MAVFIATAVAGVSVIDPSGEALLRWGADFGPRTLSGEPWRLLTSTFLHFGIIHLALNMWCLWALGTLAEPLFGWAAFLLLYLLSGLGGSVLSMLVHPMVVSAGASGAVFEMSGIEPVHCGPAVEPIADVCRSSFLTRHINENRHEAVIAVAVDGWWKPHN